MRSRIFFKIILILFMMFMVVQSFQISYGADIIKEARDWFIAARNSKDQVFAPDNIANTIAPVSQILFAVGLVVLSVVGVVMGIKFIIASPEEQGKIKEQLIGLVVSAVVILGAYTIWKFSYELMNNVITTSQITINNNEQNKIM